MPNFFGSSGYRPGDEQLQGLESTLNRSFMGQMGYDPGAAYNKWKGGQASYADWSKGQGQREVMGMKIGAPGTQQEYEQSLQQGWGRLSPTQQQGYWEQPKAPAQSFTYAPGESGYNVLGGQLAQPEYRPTSFTPISYQPSIGGGRQYQQGTYTPLQHQAYQFSAPQLEAKVTPYYAGLEASAAEAAKGGARAGMEQAAGMMGRRGVGRGGVGEQAFGNVTDVVSRNLADVNRQIGFQRAQSLQDIAIQQAQLETERQARQAAEQQFGSQFGSQQAQFGAQFGAGERQYGTGLAEQQRQYDMARQEQAAQLAAQQNQFGATLGEQQQQYATNLGLQREQERARQIAQQYALDAAMRGERQQAYMTPIQQLMQLYGAQMGAASQPQAGWGGSLIGGLGGLAQGIGSLWGGGGSNAGSSFGTMPPLGEFSYTSPTFGKIG